MCEFMSLDRQLDNERRKQTRAIAAIKRAAEREAAEALMHRHIGEYEMLVAKAHKELWEEALADGVIVVEQEVSA